MGKLTPARTWAAILRDDTGGLAEDPIGGIAFVVNLLHTGTHACIRCLRVFGSLIHPRALASKSSRLELAAAMYHQNADVATHVA